MTTINHEVNEMIAAEDKELALREKYGSLIEDLAAIYSSANKANAALDDAKGKAKKGADTSIRALAERMRQQNGPIPDDEIKPLCDVIAADAANGNANVKKARKSELVLCMEMRTHLADVINEIDEINSNKEGEDGWKPLNLRSATLKSLRVIRKEKVTPSDAITQVLDAHTYVKSDIEKLEAHISALESSKHLQVEGALHEAAKAMLAALKSGCRGDFTALDKAKDGGLELEEEKTAPDVTQELYEEMGIPADDAPVVKDAVPDEIDIHFEEPELLDVEEPDEDEFDLEAITKGLL